MTRVAWILLLVALWLLLTGGSLSSWVIGIPFVLLAIFAMPKGSVSSAETQALKLARLPAFLGYFIVESVRGGLDVSRRVFATRPRIEPGFFEYPLSLKSEPARHLFVNCISLLPGTLSADWDGDHARIHTLDRGPQSSDALHLLEQRIGHLFGEQL